MHLATEHGGMTEYRCWMVDREHNDKGMVVITYATTDGRHVRERRVAAALGTATPAAIDVSGEDVTRVTDPDRQAWYASEASRMAERHSPDDAV